MSRLQQFKNVFLDGYLKLALIFENLSRKCNKK